MIIAVESMKERAQEDIGTHLGKEQPLKTVPFPQTDPDVDFSPCLNQMAWYLFHLLVIQEAMR